MRAGKLRHRIQIQRPTHTRTGAGDKPITYSTVAKRWGEIVTTGGSETVEAQQVTASATHTVRIRYYEGLTVGYRFLFGSRAFDINHIDNVEMRNEEQICTCTERPSGS